MSINPKTDRYADIKRNICCCARQDKNIRAVAAIGSSTREKVPADEFSDLDLIIVTDSPEMWYSGEYPEKLGDVSISFIEPTLGGGMERRCIYGEDRDVDMIIFTPLQFDKALKDGVAEWVMNRGYELLYDSEGYSGIIPDHVRSTVVHPEMTEDDFVNTVNDFYFHNIWAYKKLRRGELWSAKMCIDAYLKKLLLRMIEQYQLCISDNDIWHDGRFLDSWADISIRRGLKGCFAHYDTEDCKKALVETHLLFAKLAVFVSEKKGYSYPEKAEACARSFINGEPR